MWENELIHSFWVYNSKLFIRITADGNMFEISHDNDIMELFPDIDINEICSRPFKIRNQNTEIIE